MPDQSASPDRNAELQQHLKEMFDFARSGDATTLARLLDLGVPANLRNEKGDTLLMLACYHGHADAARVLLEHGADTEIYNDNGQLPLAAAAFKDYRAIAELLCRHLKVERADDDIHRLTFAITGLSMQLYVSQDFIEAIRPSLLRTPRAIDTWADRLTGYALALVEAESARRRAERKLKK